MTNRYCWAVFKDGYVVHEKYYQDATVHFELQILYKAQHVVIKYCLAQLMVH